MIKEYLEEEKKVEIKLKVNEIDKRLLNFLMFEIFKFEGVISVYDKLDNV